MMKKAFLFFLFATLVFSLSAKRKPAVMADIFGTPNLLFTGAYESKDNTLIDGDSRFSIVAAQTGSLTPIVTISTVLKSFSLTQIKATIYCDQGVLGSPFRVSAKSGSFQWQDGRSCVFTFYDGMVLVPEVAFKKMVIKAYFGGKKGSVLEEITVSVNGMPEQIFEGSMTEFDHSVLSWVVGDEEARNLVNKEGNILTGGEGDWHYFPKGQHDIVMKNFTTAGLDFNKPNQEKKHISGSTCLDKDSTLLYRQLGQGKFFEDIKTSEVNFANRIVKESNRSFKMVSTGDFCYYGGGVIRKGDKYTLLVEESKVIVVTSQGDSLLLSNSHKPIDICYKRNQIVREEDNTIWIDVEQIFRDGKWVELEEEQPWLTMAESYELQKKAAQKARQEMKEKERQARQEQERQAQQESQE